MHQIDWIPFMAAFPILFRGGESMDLNGGEGWQSLIWDLATALERLAEAQRAEGLEPIRVVQVKEKLGGLRFYTHHTPEAAYSLIDEAECLSFTICEACGEPGRRRNDRGWLRTLCDRHGPDPTWKWGLAAQIPLEPLDWRPFRESFPILFRPGPHEGISSGVGWRDILWDLCASLEVDAQAHALEGREPPRIELVREKHGGLKVRVEHSTEAVDALIGQAEDRSWETCEACGAPGDWVNLRGWQKTLCPRHASAGRGETEAEDYEDEDA